MFQISLCMYIQMVRIGKKTHHRGTMSDRHAKLIKRATITAAIITIVYILAPTLYAIVFAVILKCNTNGLSFEVCAKVRKNLSMLYLLAVQVINWFTSPINKILNCIPALLGIK